MSVDPSDPDISTRPDPEDHGLVDPHSIHPDVNSHAVNLDTGYQPYNLTTESFNTLRQDSGAAGHVAPQSLDPSSSPDRLLSMSSIRSVPSGHSVHTSPIRPSIFAPAPPVADSLVTADDAPAEQAPPGSDAAGSSVHTFAIG